ncbi:MAG TPA: hypothetical protein QGH10_14520, partial [Armatimonadota bacterium]|nr:hypothetical protein [Armatimonadota bacterium]
EDRGKTSGVYTVQFPLIGGLLEPGKYDLSVPRSNWGIKYDKLTGAQSGRYPSANWPFQMLLANDGDSGLYLACHDPQAWPKQFYLQPGGEFRFEVYAEDAGKIPNGFETPGEDAIGVYEGDGGRAARCTANGPLPARCGRERARSANAPTCLIASRTWRSGSSTTTRGMKWSPRC